MACAVYHERLCSACGLALLQRRLATPPEFRQLNHSAASNQTWLAMDHNTQLDDDEFDDLDGDFDSPLDASAVSGAEGRRIATTMVGDAALMPRLVILGRPDNSHREPVLLNLDPGLLDRLENLASGSRSLLVEVAIRHMVDELEKIDRKGTDEDGTECVMLHAYQLDGLVSENAYRSSVPRTSLDND